MSQENKKDDQQQAKEQPNSAQAQAKKTKKINRLSPKELEKKIEETQQKMGNLNSAYAAQLLKRKEQQVQAADKK